MCDSEMRETVYYKVAGHLYSVSAEKDVFAMMKNYEPFKSDGDATTFTLVIENGKAPDYTEELRQDDEEQTIICGCTIDGRPVFEFRWQNITAGWLICTGDYRDGQLVVTDRHVKMAIDNALMVLFALATADKNTLLFHASVVSYKGYGYMFLGKSGTGKSTHSSLWQQYVDATELINDDNPVVRIEDDNQIVVYGSPWSGKTPCYRNVVCPLGGIVLLCQAPYNKICRLTGIGTYAALVPSISGKRWDVRIADGLHQSENILARQIPAYYLECLPDEEAVRVCYAALMHNRNDEV